MPQEVPGEGGGGGPAVEDVTDGGGAVNGASGLGRGLVLAKGVGVSFMTRERR